MTFAATRQGALAVLLTLGLLGQMLVLTRREVAGPDLERGRIERALEPTPAIRKPGGSKVDRGAPSGAPTAEPAPAEQA